MLLPIGFVFNQPDLVLQSILACHCIGAFGVARHNTLWCSILCNPLVYYVSKRRLVSIRAAANNGKLVAHSSIARQC